MSNYLNGAQVAQLLRAINSKRVSTDGKGFSHVEAYDIRAHLSRIFGFARWGVTVTSLDLVFEDGVVTRKKNKQGQEYGDPYTAWTVCYRATVELTVCAPDGTVLATYGDGATGEAKNQPSRGDAHDLAMKTALSQALKRCAVNLGDNFGLSLYAKGSTAALVKQTLVTPDAEPATESTAVDAHITQQLPREDEPAEPQDDPRTVSAPPTPAAPPVTAGPAAGGDTSPPPAAAPVDPEKSVRAHANKIRDLAVGELPDGYQGQPARWIAHLMAQASREGVLQTKVRALTSSTEVALKVLLEDALKQSAAKQRVLAAATNKDGPHE